MHTPSLRGWGSRPPHCAYSTLAPAHPLSSLAAAVYPIADLKDLKGLKAGASNPISMFDGYNFDGAKAYKDSKLCLMMTSNLLHDKCALLEALRSAAILLRAARVCLATPHAPQLAAATTGPPCRRAATSLHAATCLQVLEAVEPLFISSPLHLAGTTSRPGSLSARSTPVASPSHPSSARSGRGSASISLSS